MTKLVGKMLDVTSRILLLNQNFDSSHTKHDPCISTTCSLIKSLKLHLSNAASSYVWTCSWTCGDSPFSREKVWVFFDVTSVDHPRCTENVPCCCPTLRTCHLFRLFERVLVQLLFMYVQFARLVFVCVLLTTTYYVCTRGRDVAR
jgi:hypothetical protein